jgi:hypothetical protein
MAVLVDLNHKSGFTYGGSSVSQAALHVNTLIDAAITAERQRTPPRDYLGASHIGEPCSRRLVYEFTGTPPDEGKDFDGRVLRIFEAGHVFETLSIRRLRAAGFNLRTTKGDGGQFGFSAAGGKFRGHIDGVIVAGPDIGINWPVLWEHKALNAKSWNDLKKRGLKDSKPLYYAQVQIYMAYLEVPVTLFTALNKDTQELFHEIVPFDAAHAQALSDKAVAILRAAESHQLPPRIASAPDFYLCQFCPFSKRCWETTP